MRYQAQVDSYVNPVQLAQKYERMLSDEGLTQSQIAIKLGISRVRITQYLNLLKLPQKEKDRILKEGKEELITERALRKEILKLSEVVMDSQM